MQRFTTLFLSFRRVINVIYSFLGNSRRLSSNCRRFGTHYRFHLHLPMKMEPIVSSETSAIRTQTPGNYPKRNNLRSLFSLPFTFFDHLSLFIYHSYYNVGYAVAQLVGALRYKPEGHGFDSQWCHQNISLT